MPATHSRITEATVYEAHFELWGFTINWIETISDRLMNLACAPDRDETDHCESYKCGAAMSVRFQSQNKTRVAKAKKLFNSLSALAGKTVNKNRYYVHA